MYSPSASASAPRPSSAITGTAVGSARLLRDVAGRALRHQRVRLRNERRAAQPSPQEHVLPHLEEIRNLAAVADRDRRGLPRL